MHTRNGLAFGSSISAHIVSKLEISKSERREQVSNVGNKRCLTYMDKGSKLLLGLYKFGSALHNSLTYTTHIFFYIRLNLKECHGVVCNMLMWHFLVLLNYFLQFACFFYIHIISVFRFLPMVHNDKHAIYIMI